MTRKSKTTTRIPLTHGDIGTRRSLVVHRYGEPGARPKAYLQASLHADEIPAMMVQHHLIRLLDEADAAGRIEGEIVVVPAANPIGLGQHVNASHLGRYELGGGGNFNRAWPDLAELVGDKIADRLTDDPAGNVDLIRAAMRAAIEGLETADELGSLRRILAGLACDADFVLDLHCDDEALMHLYLIPQHWPDAQDLAAEIGSRATMLAEDSGGGSFDETFSTPWVKLARRFGPDRPIPVACLAATVEYRGQPDVSDELGAADARGLFRFLQRRGLIAGGPGPLPALAGETVDLRAVDVVKAPTTGIVAYRAALGARVQKGDVIAEIIDPMAEDVAASRTPVASGTDGLLFTRRTHKLVRAGEGIAKVLGREILAHRTGKLLED
jgi:predicted deacylase